MTTVINEVGNRHGRLTVIRRAGKSKGGQAVWLCRCDCGSETVVNGVYLRSGDTRSCGCLKRQLLFERRAIDETGNRHGKLIVLKEVPDPRPGLYWLCRCDCGNEAIVCGSHLRKGDTRSCGCSRRKRAPPGRVAFNSLYYRYKGGAKQRGLQWKLSKAQFRELVV